MLDKDLLGKKLNSLVDDSDCLLKVKAKLAFLFDVLTDPKDLILKDNEKIEGLGFIILDLYNEITWLEKYLFNQSKKEKV